MARRRKNGPATVALIALNIVVLGVVAVLIWQRSSPPDAKPPPPTEVVPERPPTTVDWAAFQGTADPEARCVGCNVLMLSIDIFRPDHLPCWGGRNPMRGHICELADHGVLFDDFIVQAYQTPIAQMAMFTGRYPSRTGFTHFAATLAADEPTLPESLQAAGYETVAMGSSFEVMTDMSASTHRGHGFTHPGLNPGLSFGRGFESFVYTGYRNLPTDAVPFVQQRAKPDRPYFLWLVFGTLHWPYGAAADPKARRQFDPEGYAGTFAGLPAPSFPVLSRIYQHKLHQGPRPLPLTAADEAWINGRYDVGLKMVDDFVGELLAAMPPEQAANTLVVLHGIHGEDLGEHGYFGHYDIFDTEVRQKLIVLNPRNPAQAGTQVTGPVEGVDLAPTLTDVLGLSAMTAPRDESLDGTSLRSALLSGEAPDDGGALSERVPLWEDIFRHLDHMPSGYVERIRPLLDADQPKTGDLSLRTDRWKLIHRRARLLEAQVSWWTEVSGQPLERPEWELYDLKTDPTEQLNVADDHPQVVVRLRAELLRRAESMGLQ